MIELGYKLSAEEFTAADLVSNAVRAEAAGFGFALISDHFHPWTTRQGQSPFVWTVLGAIAQATRTLRVGTAVTCPTLRIHPALVAQAAATTATLMPGRFLLGLGTGENLNEHVLGRGWPPGDVRLEMLEEAIAVIKLLWQGGVQSHRGKYYTLQDAQLFSLPEKLPDLVVASSKSGAAALAARAGDATIHTQISAPLVAEFRSAGGSNKPRFVELSVCWARDEQRARKTAHEVWSLAALEDPLFTELAQPAHFEAAFKPITEDQVAENVVCGPDPEAYVAKIREAESAGYTHACVHQIGSEQEEFLRFYEKEVLPRLRRLRRKPAGKAASRKRPTDRATAGKRAKQAARSHSAKHVARSAP
jgi:coenzyme F420-dependent glucose-6-phosphate dehydrogenase